MPWQVAFPMFVLPQVREDMRMFWTWLKWELEKSDLQDLPDEPGFDDPLVQGRMPEDVLLLQYCGYPYVKHWQEKGVLSPLACFEYSAEGVEHGMHRSVIVVAHDCDAKDVGALRGTTAAINGYDSNTGMNLFRLAVAPHARGEQFFGDVIVTGAHTESLKAVAEGKADVASIDAMTFAYTRDHDPKLASAVRVLATTQKSPVLPLFVPSDLPETVRRTLFASLKEVIANEEYASVIRDRLHIHGIRPVSDEEINVIADYESQAEKLGYPVLK